MVDRALPPPSSLRIGLSMKTFVKNRLAKKKEKKNLETKYWSSTFVEYERSVGSYIFIFYFLVLVGFPSSFILEFIALILAIFMNRDNHETR